LCRTELINEPLQELKLSEATKALYQLSEVGQQRLSWACFMPPGFLFCRLCPALVVPFFPSTLSSTFVKQPI